ncbi:MAG: hypothetical protein FWH20_07390 [Oscillospiraceae bacterium]|nr:hypothetical protein [Oscillospiraceae bacterium]
MFSPPRLSSFSVVSDSGEVQGVGGLCLRHRMKRTPATQTYHLPLHRQQPFPLATYGLDVSKKSIPRTIFCFLQNLRDERVKFMQLQTRVVQFLAVSQT